MKLSLYCIGKLSPWLQEGVDDYLRRIGRYLPLECEELKESKLGKKAASQKIIEQEGSQLLARASQGAYTVALDEKGKLFTSEQLAEFFGRHMLDGTPELTFLIGGPYGLSTEVKKKAQFELSLSPMTMTHQMVRLFLLEQIYRAMTILRNEPYHNR